MMNNKRIIKETMRGLERLIKINWLPSPPPLLPPTTITISTCTNCPHETKNKKNQLWTIGRWPKTWWTIRGLGKHWRPEWLWTNYTTHLKLMQRAWKCASQKNFNGVLFLEHENFKQNMKCLNLRTHNFFEHESLKK
jgi:hypothetical protein